MLLFQIITLCGIKISKYLEAFRAEPLRPREETIK